MTANNRLDATRLLGFASLGDRLPNAVDFKDDMLGAKLGAKVGFPEQPPLDLSRLLGFASLTDRKIVDFRDDTLDGKLGAKVGTGESSWGAELLCADDSFDQGRLPMTDADATKPADKIDFAKLLGFEGVSDQLSNGVDFQHETMDAKLGARVGAEESMF